jgi:hypothetical protein
MKQNPEDARPEGYPILLAPPEFKTDSTFA